MLARGHPVDSSIKEIEYFLLAKEFHWTPDQVDRQDAKKLRGLLIVSNAYNKIKNAEIERSTRKGK